MSQSPVSPARPAATICLVRDGAEGVEVVMCRRNAGARFMAGSWVFPGGAVDDVDGGPLAAEAVTGAADDRSRAFRAAALRELAEETGIWLTADGATTALPRTRVNEDVFRTLIDAGTRLDTAALGHFANWVTPSVLPIRFDTHFYAGRVDDPTIEPEPDGEELDRAEWVAPGTALNRGYEGEWLVPFPTRKTLQFLGRFASVDDLMKHADSLEVTRVEPKLRSGTGGVTIVLPDEADFDDLPLIPEGASEMLATYKDSGEGAAPPEVPS